MKRIVTSILLAVSMFAAASLSAQESQQRVPRTVEQWRSYRKCPIDWEESPDSVNRYAVAIRPFYLVNLGLRADFEFELKGGGQWLQFDMTWRHSGWHRNDFLEIPESANAEFNKIDGFGVGVAYKNFFTPNGWYFSAGIVFNYYNVYRYGGMFANIIEDGSLYQKYQIGMVATRYYKPGFNINIGKHMSLTRNLFLDAFIGVGYARSYCEGTNIFDRDNPFTMAYSGILCSGGFRIGWMWGSGR